MKRRIIVLAAALIGVTSLGCESPQPTEPLSGGSSSLGPDRPTVLDSHASVVVSRTSGTEVVSILDGLGAATPSTHFSVFGTAGSAIFSLQLTGPEFVLTEPTDIIEIGAFLNNCEVILFGVPQCPTTMPLTVQIRPVLNGSPDPGVVLASFTLSHDDNPLVISYESVAANFTLGPGSYFALFNAQGSDVGFLLSEATDPFNYQAGPINLGILFPSTGTSAASPGRGAVRILGTSTRGGSVVSNSGEGKPDVSCSFGQFTTTQGTAVRSASGNALLGCRFSGLEPIPAQETLRGWLCTISQGGFSETRQSQWVRSPSGSASLTCQFKGKP